MGEQRFKVGDWVRVKDNCGAPRDYKIGEICHVSAVRKDLVYCGDAAMFAKRFEPWQPRVGERVKVNYPGWEGEGEVTAEYAHGITLVTLRSGKCSGEEGGFVLRDIEPITTATTPEQPATLRIEAGKFYRTRDGRKVGPMVQRDGYLYHEGWHYNASGECCYRGRSGDCVQEDREIIAEWVDDPVAKASNDNAEPNFKVGDRVEITANYNNRISFVGSFGTIKTAPTNAAAGFRVELDDGREFPFWASEMTVRPSSAPPTTAIVALIENGQPKPSSTPHVHASTGAAEKEAKRLAAKYKGKQFGVFTLTTTHEEAAPVYDHKWQNMAALGLKIDAIKELRAVAGLDLLSAKRAVEAFENAA